MPATESGSKRRQAMAQRVAAILYGVIGIMTAELALRADVFGYGEAAAGALFVGFAMTATYVLVDVVKKETEAGAHLPPRKWGAILRDSLLVMLFPVLIALEIVAAGFVTTKWAVLLDIVLYEGMVMVFVAGFLSSYLLHRALRPALTRGTVWLVLALLLLAAKQLA